MRSLASPSSLIPSINTTIKSTQILISNVELNHHLTVRERRQLCNEWQDSKSGYSWRKGVEERLIEKLKKRYASWTQELNLITLAESNQQWWVIRVSRVCGHETAQVLGRALSHQFPEMEFTALVIPVMSSCSLVLMFYLFSSVSQLSQPLPPSHLSSFGYH
ncbi:hypothetical protein Bca52824_024621 [Brassica carinata]|uniref:Uncharacterized protein n=1 Tax=Brassica carinata TaxID=52824 RepID=A0A8X7VKF0_BRACI|nr:hypothetical protein Bca52824_024621 [Brassica carinata]